MDGYYQSCVCAVSFGQFAAMQVPITIKATGERLLYLQYSPV